MSIRIGDKIPSATLTKVTADGPDRIDTTDYFAGRRIALFSVPGAFTPTCSARHLPGFVDQADALKARGIDEIACLRDGRVGQERGGGRQGDHAG
jgi:peroxiredoxin